MGTSVGKIKEKELQEGGAGNEFPQDGRSQGLASTVTSESPLTFKYPPQTS